MSYELSRILRKIAKESNGQVTIKKVPPERRPTTEGIRALDREIRAQIDRYHCRH